MPSFTLIRPIFSEKAQNTAASGVYTFEVGKNATKTQIKAAIEAQFGVKVSKVRTQNFKPEVKRQGRFVGETKAFKKAVVKVSQGSIDLWAPASAKATAGKPPKSK